MQQSAICAASRTSRSAHLRPSGALAAAALDRLIRIGLKDLSQWHQTEQNAGGDRDEEGYEDQGGLRPYLEVDWIVGGWHPGGQASEGSPG